MTENSPELKKMIDKAIRPQNIGEAVMASIGSGHADYPRSNEHDIRVLIPGHPEIVAYKLAGNPHKDGTVDDLIKLHHLIKAQKAANDD